eukprot:Selendium_serpulae@DN2718_c0_g1_i1.p1
MMPIDRHSKTKREQRQSKKKRNKELKSTGSAAKLHEVIGSDVGSSEEEIDASENGAPAKPPTVKLDVGKPTGRTDGTGAAGGGREQSGESDTDDGDGDGGDGREGKSDVNKIDAVDAHQGDDSEEKNAPRASSDDDEQVVSVLDVRYFDVRDEKSKQSKRKRKREAVDAESSDANEDPVLQLGAKKKKREAAGEKKVEELADENSLREKGSALEARTTGAERKGDTGTQSEGEEPSVSPSEAREDETGDDTPRRAKKKRKKQMVDSDSSDVDGDQVLSLGGKKKKTKGDDVKKIREAPKNTDGETDGESPKRATPRDGAGRTKEKRRSAASDTTAGSADSDGAEHDGGGESTPSK